MKLLIVEDNDGIILSLYRALAAIYKVDTATTVQAALKKIEGSFYDCVILDLTLPDGSGLKVCEHLRAAGLTTPVLVISGIDQSQTKVILLDSGANDYMTKPFNIEELQARLRVLLREPKVEANHHRLTVGDLVLDRVRRQVQRDGQPIELRRKEFALLECLMQNNGLAVSRTTLGIYAWEDNYDFMTNTVDVHIKYLRDKVDRPFATSLIRTVHGLGYKIDASHA
jgi:DNA-binding response OmpR family regulator